jgi:hypothetical protein
MLNELKIIPKSETINELNTKKKKNEHDLLEDEYYYCTGLDIFVV